MRKSILFIAFGVSLCVFSSHGVSPTDSPLSDDGGDSGTGANGSIDVGVWKRIQFDEPDLPTYMTQVVAVEDVSNSGSDNLRESGVDKIRKCLNVVAGNAQTAIFDKMNEHQNVLLARVEEVHVGMRKVSELENELQAVRTENERLKRAGVGLYNLYYSKGVCLMGSKELFEEFGVEVPTVDGFDYSECVSSIAGRSARLLGSLRGVKLRGSLDVKNLVGDLQRYKDGVLQASGSNGFGVSVIADIDEISKEYLQDDDCEKSGGETSEDGVQCRSSLKTPAKKRSKR